MDIENFRDTLKQDLEKIRELKPMIHHITNYVAMNDSANITIAIGASPIMSFAHGEMEELVSVASALLINIGTLDEYIIQAAMLALNTAKKNEIPVLLDPVGSGATKLRTNTALTIASEGVEVIKGNQGEILSLMGEKGVVKGVDSKAEIDAEIVKKAARDLNSIIVATGKKDFITDGRKVYVLSNGTDMLGKITASGCMLGSVIASFMAVQENYLMAAMEGVACYTIAGEIAAEMSKGSGSFKQNLIDEIFRIDAKKVVDMIKLEEIV